jgi:NAD(P)-dependent dehydrogenase (short-subunit alcohol dehydrogenase family)
MNTSQSSIDLSGQVALVSGGGGVIGRAACRMLADFGARVAAFDIRKPDVDETARLIGEAGGHSIAIAGDATDGAAVDRAVSITESKLGKITLLANIAGGSVTWSPTWETDRDAWWGDVELNLKSAFLLCHRVLPGMVERGAGRIVNTASAAATAKWELSSAYTSSKAGLIRLSEDLATELQSTGVCVFSIHPGGVLPRPDRVPEMPKWMDESMQRKMLATLVDPPELPARLIAELASGRADALSGCYISAKEDLDELIERADELAGNDNYRLRLSLPANPVATTDEATGAQGSLREGS